MKDAQWLALLLGVSVGMVVLDQNSPYMAVGAAGLATVAFHVVHRFSIWVIEAE